MAEAADALAAGDTDEPSLAAAVEFLLEGLHLSKRLNKDAGTYRGKNITRS
jgi:magnesium chelatase subunit I